MKEIKIQLNEKDTEDNRVLVVDEDNKFEFTDSYEKMTIKQFQDYYKIYNSDMDFVDKNMNKLSILSGVELERLFQYTVESIKDLAKHAKFLDNPIPEYDFITTIELCGQGLEFDKEFFKTFAFDGDPIEQLHVIISKVYKPIKSMKKENYLKYLKRNIKLKNDDPLKNLRQFDIKIEDRDSDPDFIRNFFTMNYVWGVKRLFEEIEKLLKENGRRNTN